MKLKDVIKTLATCRENRESYKQYRAAAHTAMLKTEEGVYWTAIDADYKRIDKAVKYAETAIRERAVELYARAVRIFGIGVSKKHWPGVTIKDYTVVRVNPEVILLEWIRVNLPLLIEEKVDVKSFETLVKANKIPAGIAWVETEPRAQIASKL